jgi:hypothetical protein
MEEVVISKIPGKMREFSVLAATIQAGQLHDTCLNKYRQVRAAHDRSTHSVSQESSGNNDNLSDRVEAMTRNGTAWWGLRITNEKFTAAANRFQRADGVR